MGSWELGKIARVVNLSGKAVVLGCKDSQWVLMLEKENWIDKHKEMFEVGAEIGTYQ